MEQELLKVVRKLINFPFNQICVHSAALDILSVLDETYGDEPHWEELIDSVCVRPQPGTCGRLRFLTT